jgi:hypothetical protein
LMFRTNGPKLARGLKPAGLRHRGINVARTAL